MCILTHYFAVQVTTSTPTRSMGGLVVAAHRVSGVDFAIDFPTMNRRDRVLPLGNVIHFFGESEGLARVQKALIDSGISLSMGRVKSVPENIEYWRVLKQAKTIHPDIKIEETRFRLEEKGIEIDEEILKKQHKKMMEKYKSTSFLILESISTSQKFSCHFTIKKHKSEGNGKFSCWGLSKGGAVPVLESDFILIR